MRDLSVAISSAEAAEAADGATIGLEIEARFEAAVAGAARDAEEAGAALVVEVVGFAGGAMDVRVADAAAEGRVVVREVAVAAGVVPPIDGRVRVGLVMLLLDAASDVRGLAPSVEEVEAVLMRLFRPLAPAAVEDDAVGRVGGLLRLLLVAVAGDAVLLAVLAEARVALVAVGFLIGGADVLDVGFEFSMALIRDATLEVLTALGDDDFSAPDDKASRSEGGSTSDAESTSSVGGAGGASGSLVSAMLGRRNGDSNVMRRNESELRPRCCDLHSSRKSSGGCAVVTRSCWMDTRQKAALSGRACAPSALQGAPTSGHAKFAVRA